LYTNELVGIHFAGGPLCDIHVFIPVDTHIMRMYKYFFRLCHGFKFAVCAIRWRRPANVGYHPVMLVENGYESGALRAVVGRAQYGGVQMIHGDHGRADTCAGEVDYLQEVTVQIEPLERVTCAVSYQQRLLAGSTVDTNTVCVIQVCIAVASSTEPGKKFPIAIVMQNVLSAVSVCDVEVAFVANRHLRGHELLSFRIHSGFAGPVEREQYFSIETGFEHLVQARVGDKQVIIAQRKAMSAGEVVSPTGLQLA